MVMPPVSMQCCDDYDGEIPPARAPSPMLPLRDPRHILFPTRHDFLRSVLLSLLRSYFGFRSALQPSAISPGALRGPRVFPPAFGPFFPAPPPSRPKSLQESLVAVPSLAHSQPLIRVSSSPGTRTACCLPHTSRRPVDHHHIYPS